MFLNRLLAKQFKVAAKHYKYFSMEASTVKIKVRQGTLVGKEDKFDDGRPFYAFRGVPYAQPPVGPLRFQPPQPIEKYTKEVLECFDEGERCVQRDPFRGKIAGSEDCLYLNIYTPSLKAGSAPLPIMVWFHGGGFTMDSGSDQFYSPEHLIEKGVTVITLNYRIGALGFLSYPKAGISGNAGLKDQLQALKWIQENAESFGGDASNVTLFGQSAGAACAHLHLLNAESRKYFHKLICQSGSSIMNWIIQKDTEDRAVKLAQLVSGSAVTSEKEVRNALMSASGADLVKHASKVLTLADKRLSLLMPFRPTVEAESPHAIVTEHPNNTLPGFNNDTHPMMMGFNSEEGLILMIDIPKRQDEYFKDKGRIAPILLNITEPSKEFDAVVEELSQFYFDGKPLDMDMAVPVAKLLGDKYFIVAIHQTMEIFCQSQSKAPCYFYRFDGEGELNLQKMIFRLGKFKGACHGDEMFHLFKPKLMDLEPEEGSPALALRDRMCTMWTNFAKQANPTPETGLWQPLQVGSKSQAPHLNCLNIDNTEEKTKMVVNPDERRMAVWRHMYQKYNGSFLKFKL